MAAQVVAAAAAAVAAEAAARTRHRPKPFIDKVNIKTGEKTRVFEGENTGITETITTVIDPEVKKLVAHTAERDDAAAAVPVRQRDAQAAHEQRGSVPGSDADDRPALRSDAR